MEVKFRPACGNCVTGQECAARAERVTQVEEREQAAGREVIVGKMACWGPSMPDPETLERNCGAVVVRMPKGLSVAAETEVTGILAPKSCAEAGSSSV